MNERAAVVPAALVLMLTILMTPSLAAGQSGTGPDPAGLDAVRIDEKLDESIPLDLRFVDEDSLEVVLGDYFHPGRPVILVLGYYSCPMLCGLMADALLGALEPLDWTPGDEFEIVHASIWEIEGPQLANLKKDSYLDAYGRPEARSGWHFLTGPEESSRALADAVGFGYAWNEKRREWMHPAVTMILTPDGRVSRYLYGVSYDPRTLRLSLVEASEGKIGSSMDKILLTCFRYDSSVGRYGPSARRLMTVAGYVTVVALGLWLALLWRRDRRRKSR